MDWGWVYGTLARNAGWSYRKIGKMCAGDVFRFLDHLAEHPPCYVIMASRYGLKPTRNAAETDRNRAEIFGMGAALNMGAAQPVPEDIRKLVEWAESFGPQAAN